MRALRTDGKGSGKVDDIEKPSLEEDEVLVRVHACALNPTDWKSAARTPPGRVIGCDWAGEVAEMGPAVKKEGGINIGDRIAGMVLSCKYEDHGAFAEYCKTRRGQFWQIPESIGFEEATAIGGVGTTTAAQALFFGDNDIRLGLPFPYEGKTDNRTILIWSAASAVGQYAVQLAKLSGLNVIIAASAKHNGLLKGLGADHLYDYKDADVEHTIAKEHKVDCVLDCYGMDDIARRLQHAIRPEGGKIVTLIYATQKGDGWRDNVTLGATLAATCSGVATRYGAWGEVPVNQEDVAYYDRWIKLLPRLIKDGKLKPNPLRRGSGGLESIPEGLEYMKAGKVSAEKLVYRV